MKTTLIQFEVDDVPYVFERLSKSVLFRIHNVEVVGRVSLWDVQESTPAAAHFYGQVFELIHNRKGTTADVQEIRQMIEMVGAA